MPITEYEQERLDGAARRAAKVANFGKKKGKKVKKDGLSEDELEGKRLQRQQDNRAARNLKRPAGPVNLDYLSNESAVVPVKEKKVGKELSDIQSYLKGVRGSNPDNGRTLKDKINN